MVRSALHAGRIGPNAITRVAEVLPAWLAPAAARELFRSAGLVHYLEHPPQQMVDEAEVQALHAALRERLGAASAREVAAAAGRRTADYLLAHRIPKPLQRVLSVLPPRLSARVLLAAITRNAWTFVGSGTFAARVGRRVELTVRDNPLCRGVASDVPACDFYAATFERLFQVLVHARTQVTERACEACGDDCCRFEVDWPAT
jgi:divinyl protochlorophyllide a 8-vinyl-reductase